MYVEVGKYQKSHIFAYRYISELYSFVCVYVCSYIYQGRKQEVFIEREVS